MVAVVVAVAVAAVVVAVVAAVAVVTAAARAGAWRGGATHMAYKVADIIQALEASYLECQLSQPY